MADLVEVALDARAQLAEAPLWDEETGTLLWVDILAGQVHRFDPRTGSDTWVNLDAPVGAVIPRRSGGLVGAVGMTFALVHEDDGVAETLATVHRGDRFNDAACDPAGRFWAGTMSDVPGASSLYVLDVSGGVREMLDGVTLSNGLAWSPSGETMYYVDTPLRRIDAFDFDVGTGNVAGRRTVVDLHSVDGRPDGLSVDADGRLWVALARGGSVRCYRPDGRLEHVVTVPAPLVTSCAFGGDGWSDLYITSGRWSMTDGQLHDHPHAGAIFRVADVGATGLPAHRFAG
jgi:sugar lactone lactonase YvrE